MGIRIFHSDRFVPPLPKGHRFPIEKYGLIREQLCYEGTITPAQLEEAYPASEADILRVHTSTYWTAMRDLQLSARAVRKIGFPQSATLVDRSRRSVQGTLSAALYALQHGTGMNIAGGTHHAYADHGEGFCLLNDLAVAAHHLLDHQLVSHILIIDLDVHQGNGTAVIFHQEPRVFTLSVHCAANYPLRKEHSDLDIALPIGTGDVAYLNHLQREVIPLLDTLKPDLVLYQAGVDVLETDKLGKLSLTLAGCKQRDQLVLQACARREIPVAVSMGGGYSSRVATTVEAHANTFRVATGIWG